MGKAAAWQLPSWIRHHTCIATSNAAAFLEGGHAWSINQVLSVIGGESRGSCSGCAVHKEGTSLYNKEEILRVQALDGGHPLLCGILGAGSYAGH
eukprot:753895-Pelagomonas_calceolata.AAC.1